MASFDPVKLIASAVLLATLLTAWRLLYNLFLHPLRKYPGPVSHRLSRIPIVLQLWRGNLAYHVKDLHIRYGKVVRLAPDELSFVDQAAWKDIYGHRVGVNACVSELPKYRRFYKLWDAAPSNIINSDRDLHAVLRRQLAHGFSEKSMRAQEGIIGGYIDLLMQRLRENSGSGPLNLTDWYIWTTFDVIGDLALGSPFGCLEKQAYHPWVKLFAGSPKEFSIMTGLRSLGVDWLVMAILTLGTPTRKKILAMTKQALEKRIAAGFERPDLIEGLLQKSESQELDFTTVHSTSSTLIFAGSETTATLLCGVTYLLLTNPTALDRVKNEVRSSFASEEDITLLSVNKLPYMLACLNEALRLYPPVTIGLPRYTPPGGAVISGELIPEKTIVSIPHLAVNSYPEHWTEPDQYRPERFLGDPKFAADNQEVLQPFSVGPRNCIGRNLAYAEMRLILARIMYGFDLELDPQSAEWLKRQPSYTLWLKPALKVSSSIPLSFFVQGLE